MHTRTLSQGWSRMSNTPPILLVDQFRGAGVSFPTRSRWTAHTTMGEQETHRERERERVTVTELINDRV